MSTWPLTAAILIVPIALACTSSPEATNAAAAPQTATPRENRAPVIDHLTPRRDSVGPTPPRYTWTPIEGADLYAMGLWNDVDVLIYRRSDLKTPSVEWPSDVKLDPGTYFWSVAAFRDGQPIAESGRSAFVVNEAP